MNDTHAGSGGRAGEDAAQDWPGLPIVRPRTIRAVPRKGPLP